MKNTNFKKVLALVLSLAMMLSVCTMGFTANAAEAVDLSYAIINDTTVKNWRADYENMALANVDGKTVFRIAPQKAATGLLPFSSKVDLSAEQAASVNTLAYYVSNELGSDLEVGLQYYGTNGTYNAFLGNGYVYLLDDKTGDILPVYATKGFATIPVGFKGYVVFDLSKVDNYGTGDWKDSDGNPVKAVNAFKENCFKPLMLRAKYTEDMVTKAWYVGDLTVSTKSVEEFAKYVSDSKVISYNYNMASVRYMEADENIMYWGLKMDNDGNADGNAFPNIVDYDDFDGKGSEFTYAVETGKGVVGRIDIRDDFFNTRGTDLPFAIDKAVAYKYDVTVKGTVPFEFLIVGEGNYIQGTMYYVYKNGTVVKGGSLPKDFEGTVYCLFNGDDTTVKYQWGAAYYSWADFVNNPIDKEGAPIDTFNMSMYTHINGVVGSTITFGGFSFIYDATDFEANITPAAAEIGNPVIHDGSEKPKNPYRADWDISYGDHYTAVYNGSYTGTSNPNMLRLNRAASRTTFDFDVSKINGFSFEFKAPDDGYTHRLNINMEHENANVYRGQLVAIDKTGAKVATRNYQWNGGNTLNLPSGFDGIIVMTGIAGTSTEQGIWVKGYFKNDGSCTNFNNFADYYEAIGNSWYGISINVKNRKDANGNEVPFEVGNTYEYDTLKAITQDMTEYLADCSAEMVAEAVKSYDGYVVNTFTGNSGNTMTSSVASASPVKITYDTNESGTDSYAEMVFTADTSATNQRRQAMAVNAGNLDLTKAAGFVYDINITNPNAFNVTWNHQAAGENGIKNAKVYFINDSTGEITYLGTQFINKATAKGKVVVLFDENTTVTGSGYTWAEFVTLKKGISSISLWMCDRATTTITETDEETSETITKTVLTEACANFKAQFDNLAFIYGESSIIDIINKAYDTEKYINSVISLDNISGNALSKNNTTDNATYDVSIDVNAGAPGTGRAYKLTRRTANAHKAGQQIFIGSNSSLTKEEVLGLEAIAYWIKIPAGKKFMISKNINAQYNKVVSSILTYNTLTGEFKSIVEGDSLTLVGFEGYIIMPLKNALINTANNSNPKKFSEVYGTQTSGENNLTKIGGYFYIGNEWNYTATEAWIGAYQTIPSLTEFFAEIGAETTPGDTNNDTEVDVRDLVRLKKFNADSKTALAYQNADVDGNGLFETADLIASRKQGLGVDFKAPEKAESLVDNSNVMVGFYHGDYGVWDYYASDIAAETDVINAYTSCDVYSLAQMKENGGAGWMYISKSFGGEPVFGSKDSGYDNATTTLNEAWKVALDDKINNYKAKGVWNQVAGFHTEEILMSAANYMSQEQYAIMTKYLRDTYGKRVLAVLSSYEVRGNEDKGIPAATPEAYEFVTDIGYDLYGYDEAANRAMLNDLKTNIGNRTDIKYWLLPTAHSGKAEDGTPSRTDESLAAEIKMFDKIFADTDIIPENQRGGILFYTFKTFYDGGYDYPVSVGKHGSFGLDLLVKDYNYTLTLEAIRDMAAKYVK